MMCLLCDRSNSQTNALRKKLRMESDPFAMNDREFRGMFRLDRTTARELIDEILDGNPELTETRNSDAIPFDLRFLAVLNFFGNGSYQKPTAENRLFCQAQSTMSRSLHLVLDMLLKLQKKYMPFPSTPKQVSDAKLHFSTKFGMSGIIGAVDGTHIAIIQPPEKENGYLFYNRKHFYSINALAMCDANLVFNFVDARFPGSCHDSAIWTMGRLQNHITCDGSTFILGDSGFPSTPCLLTPVIHAAAGSSEERYNVAHKHTRNVVERAFGVLKTRFRCLLLHRVLHYRPATARRILYACIILHNICMLKKIPLPDDDSTEDTEDAENDRPDENDDDVENRAGQGGNDARKAYIRRFF